MQILCHVQDKNVKASSVPVVDLIGNGRQYSLVLYQ